MTVGKKWLGGVSSIIMSVAALSLVVGVLLIPNVVLGDDLVASPNNVAICGGCGGGCPNSAPPCSTAAQTCTATGTACAACTCGLPAGNTTCKCES
jgi:hypothetical protein